MSLDLGHLPLPNTTNKQKQFSSSDQLEFWLLWLRPEIGKYLRIFYPAFAKFGLHWTHPILLISNLLFLEWSTWFTLDHCFSYPFFKMYSLKSCLIPCPCTNLAGRTINFPKVPVAFSSNSWREFHSSFIFLTDEFLDPFYKSKSWPGMEAYPIRWSSVKFKGSWVYIVSSRWAMATLRMRLCL